MACAEWLSWGVRVHISAALISLASGNISPCRPQAGRRGLSCRSVAYFDIDSAVSALGSRYPRDDGLRASFGYLFPFSEDFMNRNATYSFQGSGGGRWCSDASGMRSHDGSDDWLYDDMHGAADWSYDDGPMYGGGADDAYMYNNANIDGFGGADDDDAMLPMVPYADDDGYDDYRPCMPKLVLASLSNWSMGDIAQGATNVGADFVLLGLDGRNSWWDRFRFWWSQKIPGIAPATDYGYYRAARKSPPYYLAISSEACNYLSGLLKEKSEKSLFYISSHLYLSFDDSSPMKGQELIAWVAAAIFLLCLTARWLCDGEMPRRQDRPQRRGDRAQQHRDRPTQTLFNQFDCSHLGEGEVQEGTSQDCVICLEAMRAGTKVRILPCRHNFHHDCIVGWFDKQQKNHCPTCKFDLRPHMEEQRAAAINITRSARSRDSWKEVLTQALRFRWGFRWANVDVKRQLLETQEEGDLELTQEIEEEGAFT